MVLPGWRRMNQSGGDLKPCLHRCDSTGKLESGRYAINRVRPVISAREAADCSLAKAPLEISLTR